jgi:hypothetical protein
MFLDTGEKPYACACGATFTRPDLLKRHHGLAHANLLPSVQNHSRAEEPSLSSVAPALQPSILTSMDQWTDLGPTELDAEGSHRLGLEPHELTANTQALQTYNSDAYQNFADFIDTVGQPLDWEGSFDLHPASLQIARTAQQDTIDSCTRGDDAYQMGADKPAGANGQSATILPIPYKSTNGKRTSIPA